MKSKLTIMLCAACLCLWTGCRPQQTERQGHEKDSVITVSIEPLRYIAERIAEQHGLTCRNLSGGYRFYEAAKLDAEGQAAAEKEYEYCGMEKQK